MSTVNLATIQSNTALPPTIQNSSAVEIGTFCRAWVNFNGTGTVAIRASFNVTSITDTGVGDYLVNFTTAMQDTNYIALIGGVYNRFVATNNDAGSFTHTTTQMRCTMNDSVGLADSAYMQITVFR